MPAESADTGLAGPALRDRQSLEQLAARILTWLVSGVGLAAIAAALAGYAGLFHSTLHQARLEVGLVLVLAGALAQPLRSRGRPREASSLMLLATLAALILIAYRTGLGVHTLSLAAATVLIALAGGIAGMRSAGVLAAIYCGAVGLMGWAEGQGLLPGRETAHALGLADRMAGHWLIAFGALFAAFMMDRVLGTALRQALQESDRLGMLVRYANNWDWEADTRLEMRHVSANFEALTGQKPAVFLKQRQPGGAQIVDGEDLPLLLEDFKARRAYKDRVTLWHCPDGSLLWSLDTGEPIFDAAGEHIGWRGVSHNITAQKLAEQAHRRTVDMLDRLVHVSPDPICVAKVKDGRLLFVNEGFCRFVGRAEAEMLGRSGVELGLWADETEAYRMRASLRERGQVQAFRSLVRSAAGHWHDVLISAATFDWDGEVVSVFIVRDITESEHARVEGEAILDNASVGIALMRGARLVRTNPQWRQIFGRADIVPAEGQEALPGADAIAAAAQAFERDFIRPDGRRITVRFNARALASSPGAGSDEPTTIWVTEDVTERLRQERELAEAKRQAESANAAKGAFLATMSHEIRTPLNGVLGLAKLVQQARPDDPRRAEYLNHLVGSAQALNEIVSNVLDLSKIEAGALHIEEAEFDLHALVHAAFEGSELLGRERGLTMDCHIEPGVPRLVRGDSLRVRQIIANYLGNALKFTERGGISLEVAPAARDRIRLAVHDTGVGVPAALQGQLFKPFAQADASTTRRFGGTGLGLSICRELAERMGGSVGLASDGSNGSSFWAELALPAVELQPSRAPEAPRYPLSGLRVLVAEDNPVNLLIVAALLQRLGAEVVEAEDGAQAVQIAKAQAGRLDAVLMDLHMPLIDGLRATQLLRAHGPTAALPIHAFTAAALEQERQAAFDAGMNGFLTKPIVEDELLRLLKP